MMDQKAKFSPRGIVTDFVGEVQDSKEAVMNVLHGKAQLVFISQEGILCNPKYREMLLNATNKKHVVVHFYFYGTCMFLCLSLEST